RERKNKNFRQAPGYTVAHLSVTLILTQARDTHVNREGNLLEQQALTGGIYPILCISITLLMAW
ncbi:TPA: hypothetical protein ACOEEQ_002696, partial [Enterobacter asburiae]